MTRTNSANWESAPTGGQYSSLNDGSFSTDGAHGVVSVPADGNSRTATLSSVSARDASASIALSLGNTPVGGGGVSTGILLRSAGGSYYRGSIKQDPSGQASLSITRVDGSAENQTTIGQIPLQFSLAAGALVFLEFRATGSDDVSLSARAWQSGTDRPDWQVTAIDPAATSIKTPGAVALWSYVSAGTAASTIHVDNFLVTSDATTAAVPAAPAPVPAPAPAPAPAPEPAPAPAPAPAPIAQTDVGSAQLGSTSYPIPGGAVFVSPQGNDGAAGTQSSPLRTVGSAISRAASGGTIIMRAGGYHEGVVIPNNKALTIQSYPGEAAWFEGSSAVGNWAKTGAVWSSSNWTAAFDSSPTFTFGAPDSSSPNWRFVNPAYPMAAHPDQVWVNGTAQQQVASLAQVSAGKFFVDYGAKKLFLGSDPTNSSVRASDIAKAISVRGAGSTIRGIGVERFAPSVAHMGAVTVEKPNVTVENVVINDSATTGLFVMESGNVIRNVTLLRNGMLGSSMSTADNLAVSGMLARGNNTERFNNAPVSGGLKISRSRGLSVSNSDFSDNAGPGLWIDESVYDGTIAGNVIANNSGHGLILEISTKFVVANNIIAGNRDNGIKLNNTSNVAIWNNTLTGNGRSINIVQDARRADDRSTAGHDPRQPFPDRTMNWVNTAIVVSNNVIAATSAPDCLLCVQDYTGALAPASGIRSNGNVFHRASAGSPRFTVLWAPAGTAPVYATTLGSFVSATGLDSRSVEVTGPAVTTSDGKASDWLRTHSAEIALPVPSAIASLAKISGSPALVGSFLR